MKIRNKSWLFTFIVLGLAFTLTISCSKDDYFGGLKDIDGNTYKTVKIGRQTWMAENLRVTRFNDGTKISGWIGGSHYSWFNNDSINYSSYGALYNFRVVKQTLVVKYNIAPKGWHIPSNDEWNKLIEYLGGDSIAGGKLKSTGTIEQKTGLWHNPNTGATNESEFSALPGGMSTDYNGLKSYNIGFIGEWWSTTHTQQNTNSYRIYYRDERIYFYEGNGFNNELISIRCIKD